MKAELLSVLRDADDYVSGQDLCEKFGVSRTAVWKGINQLKDQYQGEAAGGGRLPYRNARGRRTAGCRQRQKRKKL